MVNLIIHIWTYLTKILSTNCDEQLLCIIDRIIVGASISGIVVTETNAGNLEDILQPWPKVFATFIFMRYLHSRGLGKYNLV